VTIKLSTQDKMPRPRKDMFDSLLSTIPMKNHRTRLHIAIIQNRGKIISIATNALGSRSKGCGYSDRTIHAERAAIKKLGNLSLLKGATMTVIRIKDDGTIANSMPCHSCYVHLMKCIKEHGLRRVFYSITDKPSVSSDEE
jgi:hypothetical protein